MNHVSLGSIEFFFSEELDLDKNNLPDIGTHVNTLIKKTMNRKMTKTVLSAKIKDMKMPTYAILQTHGSKSSPWTYEDKGKIIPVQNWINEHDGRQCALFLYVCNEGNQEISSKYSVVFHTTGNFSMLKLMQRKIPFRAYVPEVGYIKSNREAMIKYAGKTL